MNIQWFGQSCFRIEIKDGTVLIDPFSKEIGLKPPKIKDDLVLVTHDHSDHNNLEGLNEEAFVVDSPGEYERKGIHVQGIPSFHDKTGGTERGLNTIYVIKCEEMTICHLGDLGQDKLTDDQVETIGSVDVLLIPVGGNFTIDYKEAVGVIGQIEPKIIVPMHYQIDGLKVDLDTVDRFMKEVGLTPEKLDKLKVSSKTLPVDEMKLVVLEA
jgi:L-ascorbate metabolism protein UlaG (beta-lactamase superfamily)